MNISGVVMVLRLRVGVALRRVWLRHGSEHIPARCMAQVGYLLGSAKVGDVGVRIAKGILPCSGQQLGSERIIEAD